MASHLALWAVTLAVVTVGCGGSPGAPTADGPPPTDTASVDVAAAVDAARDAAPDVEAPDALPPDDGGADDGPAPAFYPPSQRGPYETGVFQAQPYDAVRSRLVPLFVWYPATGPGTSRINYGMVLQGGAWQDAPPATADGPFPVVLFSHGFKGIAFQSFSLTEYLASHGFLVVAPNHQGNTLWDFTSTDEDVAQVTLQRPKDIGFAYGKVVEYAATPGHVLAGLADGTRAAVTGHSFGGFTTLIVAGAVADMDRAKQACAQGVAADIFCPYVSYYAPGTALTMNPRIPGLRAMIAYAPGGYNAMFDDGLAAVYVPGLVMGGTEDTTCPLDLETRPIYTPLPRPKAKAELGGATHMSFTNICSIPAAQLIFGDMCQATMTEQRAFAIVNTLSTAYLRRHVNDELAMDAYLADAYVQAVFAEVAWLLEP
ncbi:MAG: hypothetical protein HY906_21455 [Deltaproteobacteria bacterium]|nr:hypothetical protein [Deltaproteobacteria bacterium]